MKHFSLLISTLVAAQSVAGHYIWRQLKINDVKDGVNEHIRKNTNHNSPITRLDDTDLRCNAGGSRSNGTATAEVTAGSKIVWITDQQIYHQGPVSFYMTKVASADGADGSTKWFKIQDIGPKFNNGQADWSAAQQKETPVTIPKCLANGEYLLRAQQLGLHNPGAVPQFYIACAQIKVTGGGKREPSGQYLVSIPGAFKETDAGYKVNIYNGFKSYQVPGPQVWSCSSAPESAPARDAAA